MSWSTRAIVLSLLATSFALAAENDDKPANNTQPNEEATASGPAPTREPARGRDAPYKLDTTVITPTRYEDTLLNVPYAASSVSSEEINRRMYRTVPQALRNIPGVMVQETAIKGGSPYIRGFTSFHNLFLIDGIRLNNSVFRDGPNQYWNTVDALSLDRIEVFKGAGAVQYGSDAVGGTVNVITKNPYTYGSGFNLGGDVHAGGRGYYRFSQAEHSHIVRGEGSVGFGDHTGLLLGGTYKDFGDVTAGEGTGRQTHTGYDEYYADFKAEHFINPDTRLVFLHQRNRQNNAPRTHRTIHGVSWEGTEVGSDRQRDYDQERELTYLQFHAENIEDAFFDTVRASVSHHYQGEVEHRIRGSGAESMQGFDVDTFGLWMQMEADTPIGRLMWGFDYYRDWVDSFDSTSDIQGPVADDSTYDLLGFFVQDKFSPIDRLDVHLGVRFTYARVDVGSVDVGGTAQSFDESWFDVSGNGRVVYHLVPEHWNIYGGISQAFRAPNLSDLTRDSDFGGGTETPAPGLDPEHYLQFELGTKAQYDKFSVESAVFYTMIRDQILRVDTGPGDEFNKINADEGFILGFEFGMAYRICPELTLFGNFTYLDGEVDSRRPDGSSFDDYPSRIMPPMGQVGLRYEPNNLPLWAETMVVVAGDADRLSQANKADDERIPPGGTPGYALWHIRGGWQITDNVDLTLAVENLTNEDYRVHGSGTNSPGRNFILGFDVQF